uniref:Uncharacterized protein n=1 Tax=Anguilla anguilla TaxID=7936 RepID=A0A0E9VL76_ANGAN
MLVVIMLVGSSFGN